jgi:hypothetical protein
LLLLQVTDQVVRFLQNSALFQMGQVVFTGSLSDQMEPKYESIFSFQKMKYKE